MRTDDAAFPGPLKNDLRGCTDVIEVTIGTAPTLVR